MKSKKLIGYDAFKRKTEHREKREDELIAKLVAAEREKQKDNLPLD